MVVLKFPSQPPPPFLLPSPSFFNQVESAINCLQVAQKDSGGSHKGTSPQRRNMEKAILTANATSKELYEKFRNNSNSAAAIVAANKTMSDDSSGGMAAGIKMADVTGAVEQAAQYGNNFLATPQSKAARAEHNKLRREFQREMMRLERLTKRAEGLTEKDVMRVSAVSGGRPSDASFQSFEAGVGGGGGVGGEEEGDTFKGRVYDDAGFSEAVVMERKREIEGIQSSMIKINEVYNDLANLVDEQQVEIDDIEQNIARTHERTQAGIVQLEKATVTQKVSGRCFRWIIGVVLLGCLVAIGILYGPEIVGSGK